MIESIPNTTQLLMMNETVPHQQSTLNGAPPYTVHYSRDELLSLANVSRKMRIPMKLIPP